MVSPWTHWTRVVRAYLRDGEAGLDGLADRLEDAAHRRPDGKFGKGEALYLPQAPMPPTLWRTSCGRCRFWEEGEPGEAGRCHIVGRPDDRFGGEAIHYRGWCAYWMPPQGEPPFAWVHQRLDPDGRTTVRGRYDVPLTAKERERETQPTGAGRTTEPAPRREAIRRGEDDDR